ncbi:MAG: winged helix-turn-helix domain-containing protein [Chloroflexota bacterium]|jgi:predicted transcriptional regulator|nr:winged helix-turn-helix domain-containing protein [Candidatus Sulfotelmatobacter sp.]
MGKHRDKVDIVAKVLMAASQNVGKTQIMYQANLNYDMLMKYLTEALNFQFVMLDSERRFYQITDKGQEFLEAYREYSKANKKKERQLRITITKRKDLEKMLPPQLSFAHYDTSEEI